MPRGPASPRSGHQQPRRESEGLEHPSTIEVIESEDRLGSRRRLMPEGMLAWSGSGTGEGSRGDDRRSFPWVQTPVKANPPREESEHSKDQNRRRAQDLTDEDLRRSKAERKTSQMRICVATTQRAQDLTCGSGRPFGRDTRECRCRSPGRSWSQGGRRGSARPPDRRRSRRSGG
jgi:hypothetical protein